jgi:hypothetical protein
MASYLEPRPKDAEIIEAIRYHFPVSVQRVMLNTQMSTIGETLELLKRVELLETHEPYSKGQHIADTHRHNTGRPGPSPQTSDRNRGQGQVRRTQYHQSAARNNYGRGPRSNFYGRGREIEQETEGSQRLNPQATAFDLNYENGRTDLPRTSAGPNSGN